MSNTAQRGEEVRDRLLTAASDLIAEHGWSAVSTRMVAQHAGVTPGLVHYHFSSVRDLLTKAALHTVRSLVDEVGAVLTPDTNLTSGLAPLLGSLDQYSGHDLTSRLFAEAYLQAHRDPELRTGLTHVLFDVRTHVARWLAANGVPTPEDTASVLLSTIDGMMLHRVLTPDLSANTYAPILARLLSEHDPNQTHGRETR